MGQIGAFEKDIRVFAATEQPFNSGQGSLLFRDNDFTDTQIDGICSVVRDVYLHLLEDAPKDLVCESPRSVPLFCMNQMAQAGEACVFVDDRELAKTDDGQVVGRKPAKFLGLGINFPSGKAPSNMDLQMYLYHEFIHVLIRNAIQANHKGPVEALVHRIEKERFPIGSRCEEMSIPWKANATISTTGLCPTGLSSIDGNSSSAFLSSLYKQSYVALDNVTIDEAWKLATVLSEQTKNRGYYLDLPELCSSVGNIIPDKSADLLTQPTFQPITEGDHYIILRAKAEGSGDVICIHTMNVKKGREKSSSGFVNDYYSCSDIRMPLTELRFLNAKSSSIIISPNIMLNPVHLFRNQDLLGLVQRRGYSVTDGSVAFKIPDSKFIETKDK